MTYVFACLAGASKRDALAALILQSLLQVVDAKVVLDRPAGKAGSSASKVAECLVGDQTGVIVFSAKNEQGLQS